MLAYFAAAMHKLVRFMQLTKLISGQQLVRIFGFAAFQSAKQARHVWTQWKPPRTVQAQRDLPKTKVTQILGPEASTPPPTPHSLGGNGGEVLKEGVYYQVLLGV